MTDSSSSPSRPPAAPPAALSVGSPIAGLWTAKPPSGGDSRQEDSRKEESRKEESRQGESRQEKSRLESLTPIEREGARYGYKKAGRPFGPGREGLETWLELRARARGEDPAGR